MAINADKPHLWKADVVASVDLYNQWFLSAAPVAYRDSRSRATEHVRRTLERTANLSTVNPAMLESNPSILPVLRMTTAPPIARDRLIGLASANKSLVLTLERGQVPPQMPIDKLNQQLSQICEVVHRLLDRDLFPWLAEQRQPSEIEQFRAATIVADRLCGAAADPIIRNAQEQRQLALISSFLQGLGYELKPHPPDQPLTEMAPGTFAFRMNVLAVDGDFKVKIPVDVVIQPRVLRPNRIPLLIEAKSAGDFANTNKRRKEEATKVRQLRKTYGDELALILFLCGYFDAGYLGYEAAEGLDWVWEHRIKDLQQLGL